MENYGRYHYLSVPLAFLWLLQVNVRFEIFFSKKRKDLFKPVARISQSDPPLLGHSLGRGSQPGMLVEYESLQFCLKALSDSPDHPSGVLCA